jgi:hypothetical protein
MGGFIVLWLMMATIVAMIANSKGRSVVSWFPFGFLIWPIALVAALLAKPEV